MKVWDEAVLGMMERIGNDVANEAWEAELYNDSVKWVLQLAPALPCPALPCPALPCPALPVPCPALCCPALSYALTHACSIIHMHDMSRSKECRECCCALGLECDLVQGSKGKAWCCCPTKRCSTAMWCCCTTTCQRTPAQAPQEALSCPCGTACGMPC